MKTSKLFFAAFLILVSTNVFAQDTETDSHNLTITIPEVALLDIETTDVKDITLGAEAPTEAGEKVIFDQTNNDLWINYSSIVGDNQSRNVTVQITNGDVPNGLDLTVIAGTYQGNGKGTLGTAVTSALTLDDKNAHNIIETIGSCYTEDGANKGHQLTYKIVGNTSTADYASLRHDSEETLTVTYTLTDE
ncbi:MAG TPA: hypothetical protein VJ970_07010 [Flavobacteriaceae bacterium]|nr:hypothetical protein [Flavobacteriaceae bacterium]